MDLLRDNGLHSFIVPNKLASAEYASEARKLLTKKNSLLLVRDYSEVPVFPVAVYPLVYIVQKTPRKTGKVIVEKMASGPRQAEVADRREIEYGVLQKGSRHGWRIFSTGLKQRIIDKILRNFPELHNLALVRGGATTSEAYELLELLEDADTMHRGDLKVLNSGTIDPHEALWGRKKMRYLKHTFARPVVRRERLSDLPATRLQQSYSAKVIIAGMTKSLECLADTRGEYLAAKSTTIVLPQRNGIDLIYLAALLNSKLMGYIYADLFGGLALQGGYLRVGPPQVKRLPIAADGDARLVASSLRKLKQADQDYHSATTSWDRERYRQSADTLRHRLETYACQVYGLNDAETAFILQTGDKETTC